MAKRIEICGSIGSGKTTLTEALARHGFTPMFESFAENPHLSEFQSGVITPENAYKNDLWFLRAQEQQLQALHAQKTSSVTVMDYCLAASRAFVDVGANTNDKKEELQNEWDKVCAVAGEPDLIIVLRVGLDKQKDRIAARARPGEEQLQAPYLQSLNQAIDQRLKQVPDHVKVIELDAEKDLRKPYEVERLVRQINQSLGLRAELSR